jgi:hypothetical protein
MIARMGGAANHAEVGARKTPESVRHPIAPFITRENDVLFSTSALERWMVIA